MHRKPLALALLVLVLMAVAPASAIAQQPTTDIWRLVPQVSLLVAAFDARPDNASIRAITATQDLQTSVILAKQKAAMRKAIEDFATLFGVSLDFARDIDPWQDEQWAFVLLPGEKKSKQPVFLIASKDAAAANAALQKMLEPWSRLGEVTPEPDQDFPITAFRTKDRNIQLYASASGPVAAIGTSKDALKTALRGGGLAAGSTAEKALTALSGSMFYAYADPALLTLIDVKPENVPVQGIAIGVSAVDTGMKLRVLGYPTEAGAEFLDHILADQQQGGLAANPGVPSNALVAVSLPNLAGPVEMAGAMGFSKAPIFSAALAVNQLQVSGALTAVFPKPAWVVSGMADTPESAAEKKTQIEQSLRASKVTVLPVAPGVSSIRVSDKRTMYISQVGRHVLVAGDQRSLSGAASVINGAQPGVVQSKTYQETMAGLGDSNLLTLYANLAPIQGLGFLAEGLGLNQITPLHDSLAKSLQDVQSLGIGVGFDGEVASATIFLRAKPGMGTTIGPAAIGATAIGAAILFPVFQNAREQARVATCMFNMRQLALAANMYAADHDGKLPTMTNWREQLRDYTHKPIDEILECPGGEAIIAFNKNMGGLRLNSIQDPSSKVLFFEARPDLPNATGSRANAILPHSGRGNFAFVDGHVEGLDEAPAQPQWVPTSAKAPAAKPPAKKPPVRKRSR